jgi:RimJ/RimL family protein N-acetyltransferase
VRNPFIVGEKVYLRAIEEDDAAVCHPWFSDPDVRITLGRRTTPNTEQDSRAYIRGLDARTRQMFAVVARADDVYIGNAELFGIHWVNRHAELGIVIGRKDFWGKGYGRETVRLLCEHAFRGLNLHRVHLRVDATNERGIRCYTGAGFKPEGRLRDDVFAGGRYVDTLILGLLRGEIDLGRAGEAPLQKPPSVT